MKKSAKKATKGRPRKQFGHKTAQISLHVEPKVKERFLRAALHAEMNFPDWLRYVIEDAARRELESGSGSADGGN